MSGGAEFELIRHFRARVPQHPAVELGPGDDAAVVCTPRGERVVVTVDMLSDGVDFELDRVDTRRVGHKALAVSLSDIAAMAARPLAAVIAVLLPRRGGMEVGRRLAEGFVPLAEEFHLALAGGDTNTWDGPLAISSTVFGTLGPRGPLTRGGARPGDRIVVTGAFGGSILGRHLDFRPRVAEALHLQADYTLHAGIDVSDGLAIDLSHLLEESGCGAVLHTAAVPIHDDARRLAREQNDGRSPLDHALGDGEDFELILAVPAAEAERLIADQPLAVPLTVIGEFVAKLGLFEADPAGSHRPLAVRGWEHRFEE